MNTNPSVGADGHEPRPFGSKHESSLLAQELSQEAIQLNEIDRPWLEALRGQPIDPDWLEAANGLLVTGSINLVEASGEVVKSDVITARRAFWGELMDWDNPDHKLHTVYDTFQAQKSALVPLTTSITTLRYLNEQGFNNTAMLRSNVAILWKKQTTIQQVVSTLESLGHDPVRVLRYQGRGFNCTPAVIQASHQALVRLGQDPFLANPTLLFRGKDVEDYLVRRRPMNDQVAQFLTTYCLESLGMSQEKLAKGVRQLRGDLNETELRELITTVEANKLDGPKLFADNFRLFNQSATSLERRIRSIGRMCRILGWDGAPAELMNYNARLLVSSDAKLMTHARLFARFGRPTMSNGEIASMMQVPLESHLITVALGKPYTGTAVRQVYDQFPAETRQELVNSLFANRPLLISQVGRQTVQAYERYTARKNLARNSY